MAGISVSLAASTTIYNLLDLIQATTGFENTKPACRELKLTGDTGNSTGVVYGGSAEVSSSNYGFPIITNATQTFRSDQNNIPLGDIYMVGSTNTLKVNVYWSYA